MSRRKQRLVLVGVFALFFIPVLMAWLLRINPIQLNTVNYGVLLDPPRQTTAASLTIQHALENSAELFADDWTMVVVGTEDCAASCRENLIATRQARTAINKDFDRVRRILVTTQSVASDAREELLRLHPDLTLVTASATWVEKFTAAHAEPGAAWLVDPRGYQFMHYPGKLNASHILKDLKRLLKISAVG